MISAPPTPTTGRAVTICRLGLLAAFLAPVWLLDYFPTQDGPAHLYNAWLLRDFVRPDSPFREFFEVRTEPVPNWFIQVLLMGLYTVVPPLVAQKVLVSLYVVLFAHGFDRFLAAVRPGAAWVGLL